jgi:hypothetical protein
MTRFVSASILAAAVFVTMPAIAGAADYPTCKSRSEDRCMQMPDGMMKDMMKEMKPSNGMGMKGQMDGPDSMMKGAKPMMGDKGATMGSGIPRGCSPATTPCE